MLMAEWIRLRKKKSLYILPLIPLISVIFWIVEVYTKAVELSHLDPDPTVPGSGQPLGELLYGLRPEFIFSQSLAQIVTTIYFFPLILVGVMWVYDDLKNNILANVATVHQNRIRYFTLKISSLSIYFLIILAIYFIIFTLASFIIPDIPVDSWYKIFTLATLKSFAIYFLSFIFWAVVSMMITYLFNSPIAGAGVTIFYLMFERIFTAYSAFTLHSSILMKINEYLPWAIFNTWFYYAAEISPNQSTVQPLMYRLEEYTEKTFIPMPFAKDFLPIFIYIIIYSVLTIFIFWKLYQYRISKS